MPLSGLPWPAIGRGWLRPLLLLLQRRRPLCHPLCSPLLRWRLRRLLVCLVWLLQLHLQLWRPLLVLPLRWLPLLRLRLLRLRPALASRWVQHMRHGRCAGLHECLQQPLQVCLAPCGLGRLPQVLHPMQHRDHPVRDLDSQALCHRLRTIRTRWADWGVQWCCPCPWAGLCGRGSC